MQSNIQKLAHLLSGPPSLTIQHRPKAAGYYHHGQSRQGHVHLGFGSSIECARENGACHFRMSVASGLSGWWGFQVAGP
jgi:hypothetical protein